MNEKQLNDLLSKTRDSNIRKKTESKLSTDFNISLSRIKNVTPKIALEIYNKCLGEHRSSKYFRQLGKEYNLGYYTINAIAQNDYSILNISKSQHKKNLEQWNSEYGYVMEVRSPGNDLLDFYDQQNEQRGLSQRLMLPPSVIYYYRFVETDWTPKQVKELFPHIKGNSLLPLLRERLVWLTDTPSIRKICYSQEEVFDYVRAQTNAKTIDYTVHSKAGLGWHGSLAGWSFVRK